MKTTPTNENIKWQIHAESCVHQIMLWIIVARLFNAWYVDVLAFIMITGNFLTVIKAGSKLPKNYFK